MPHEFKMEQDARWADRTEIYGIRRYQRFPRRDKLCVEALAQGPNPSIRINKQTRIVALGSCFAQTVSVWLRDHGYTLLDWNRPASPVGMMYHTDTLRQELECAAYGIEPPKLRFKAITHAGPELIDPFRSNLAWDSEREARDEPNQYRRQLTEILRSCDVLIFTAGQTEAWQGKESYPDWSFAMVPPPSVFDRKVHAPHRLPFQRDLRNLQASRRALHALNPKAQMVLTVSPVPLLWTTEDMNVIVAAMDAKAQLRAAIGEFVSRHDDVEYFPSFEAVMWCLPHPYRKDNRHVTPEAVDAIMRLFEAMYCDG